MLAPHAPNKTNHRHINIRWHTHTNTNLRQRPPDPNITHRIITVYKKRETQRTNPNKQQPQWANKTFDVRRISQRTATDHRLHSYPMPVPLRPPAAPKQTVPAGCRLPTNRMAYLFGVLTQAIQPVQCLYYQPYQITLDSPAHVCFFCTSCGVSCLEHLM